jgi:hypothetical protein
MEFQVLTKGADILKAARNAVATTPSGGEKKWHRLMPPPSTGLHHDLAAVFVWMPVDQRLQELGERMAKSNRWDFRAVAPDALRPFKSEKNIAILKKLLSDELHWDITDKKGHVTRHFPAREPAYWVLQSWGVPVEKPVTDVELRGLEGLAQAE